MMVDALWCDFTKRPSFSARPQNIELGATGGASKQDSSKMEDMTVEQMTMRANQVTDEVLKHTIHTQNPSLIAFFLWLCMKLH